MNEEIEKNNDEKIEVIEDDEILYRCVFYGESYYKIIEKENRIVVSSQAFTDRMMLPSVDRAKLCDFNPYYTQKNQEDGVVRLLTKEIRLLQVDHKNSKDKTEFCYAIDVVYRPLPDNFAHSQIESSPAYQNKGAFRRLLERLSRLVKQEDWEIKPHGLR
jgi:hypothetical protein